MTKPLEQLFKEFCKNIKKKDYQVSELDIEMLKSVNKWVDSRLYTSPKEIGGYAPIEIDSDSKSLIPQSI
jgi:hypothetical protein